MLHLGEVVRALNAIAGRLLVVAALAVQQDVAVTLVLENMPQRVYACRARLVWIFTRLELGVLALEYEIHQGRLADARSPGDADDIGKPLACRFLRRDQILQPCLRFRGQPEHLGHLAAFLLPADDFHDQTRIKPRLLRSLRLLLLLWFLQRLRHRVIIDSDEFEDAIVFVLGVSHLVVLGLDLRERTAAHLILQHQVGAGVEDVAARGAARAREKLAGDGVSVGGARVLLQVGEVSSSVVHR